MEPIRDDETLTPERFKAFVKLMGWRTQKETAEALGVTQAYVSNLTNGQYEVLPRTSLHKLVQALMREHDLIRRLQRSERNDEGPVTP
ncbi:helix-turn-helix transcriptional regulator [Longimicrobium sp.]|uniref:helix-turn-helix transcriptional regulator n=1 Tax=Longimicrobium sp. TaxID=2029185 RepID=UPI002E3515F1|nr:helix-turn-helix transcriptional regulator [Longimicrobium sp.]HEX6039509.1 helix-turn-helix transcriptional regulator [Longimicrobium sp.]